MTQEALFPAGDVSGGDAVPVADTPPAWLAAVLEVSATWRRSAHAKLERCRWCGAWTLFAADMGWDLMTEARVDPALITRDLEVACLLAGRGTAEVEVSRAGGGPLVFSRDRWLALRDPAERGRLWVPLHVCGAPLGWALPLEVFFPLEFKIYGGSENDNECAF